MLFNSLIFIVFLAITLSLSWLIPVRFAQTWLLVAASVLFYAVGEPIFVFLLVGCAGVGYIAGLGMARFTARRGLFLLLALLLCFGTLVTFKYYNFFVGSVAMGLGFLGVVVSPGTLSLALPIGISFFTFQTAGYVIDVFQGRLKPERSFGDFMLFVCFFPQLVAGPIERSDHLLPQIKQARRVTPDDVVYGVFLMVQGFAKKVVIADNLAPVVNVLFSSERASGPMVIVALIAFAFQIYGDFSGYTDIARGVARLFGFRILLNFRVPYAARSVTEFWRRWHITLSTWFRDYVYLPLGGSRRGRLRTYGNIFATMLLSGLWHGASYTFLLWGAYHGVLVCLHKMWMEWVPDHPWRRSRGYRWLAQGATFALVVYGWLFFRATGASQCLSFTNALLTDWQFLGVALVLFLQMVVVPKNWTGVHSSYQRVFSGQAHGSTGDA